MVGDYVPKCGVLGRGRVYLDRTGSGEGLGVSVGAGMGDLPPGSMPLESWVLWLLVEKGGEGLLLVMV